VNHLVHPPSLFNPLRKSNSVKRLHEEASISAHSPNPQHAAASRPTPIKPRSKSEDKPSSIYSNSKSYTDPSDLNSAIVMKISELDETPVLVPPHKGVTFRDNLMQKNEHNRRGQQPIDCRTPSILKRSQLLR
jgi:hypothetical protein